MDDCSLTESSKVNIIDKFREAFPIYMLMGMTPAEYWEGSPDLCVSYRKLFELKTDRENYMAWLNGLYIYDALTVTLVNAFKKKGTKSETYVKEPFKIRPLTRDEEERERIAKRDRIIKMLELKQKAWASAHKGDEHG